MKTNLELYWGVMDGNRWLQETPRRERSFFVTNRQTLYHNIYIALPQGYSSLLAPIVQQIPEELVLKQKPIKEIHWRYKEEEDDKEGYESDGSNCSVRTVKSVGKFLFLNIWVTFSDMQYLVQGIA